LISSVNAEGTGEVAMFSAILMAGYNNKREVKRYAKIVAEHYGEKFIETGYKPLRDFKAVVDGKLISKPLIIYTLEKLYQIDLIDEIIIVGHQMLLEKSLNDYISQQKKPCRIINQNSAISEEVKKQFDIIPRKVKYNSVAGNLIKGYTASDACKSKKHALLVASDSPMTTIEFIEKFIHIVESVKQDAAIIVPAVVIESKKDKLGRYPLKLQNDSQYQLPVKKDKNDRQGFRLSSLMCVNPYLFDINTANTAYSLRKALNPNIQVQLFRITRKLGYPNVYSKYFIRKDLSIKEVENITSAFFGGKLNVIPMLGEEATYDYDGTELEYRMISDMLKSS
jgi:hypothetical protein